MRIPILNNNAVTMESPGNVSGSLNYGGPVPEGYMRLSDFINETGRAFFPNEWTGEECQGSWQLSFIEGFDGWLGSLIEYRVQKSLKFHEWKLRYIADGCTPSEARRRIAYRIECDKHTVAADKLRDELEKIDALLLEIKSNPPKHDSFLSETALVNRITGIEGQLEVHEGYDCFEGDLPNANTDDIEKLNRRFAKLNERCRKIKERRRVAIADGLRGALWKGDIPAGHLSLDGEFISMDRSIWYRNPDWIETMVHSCIQCQRDREPEWKGERRSILVEHAKAKEWLDHATKREPAAVEGTPIVENSAELAVLTSDQAQARARWWHKEIFQNSWKSLISPERRGKNPHHPNERDFATAFKAAHSGLVINVTTLEEIHRECRPENWGTKNRPKKSHKN